MSERVKLAAGIQLWNKTSRTWTLRSAPSSPTIRPYLSPQRYSGLPWAFWNLFLHQYISAGPKSEDCHPTKTTNTPRHCLDSGQFCSHTQLSQLSQSASTSINHPLSTKQPGQVRIPTSPSNLRITQIAAPLQVLIQERIDSPLQLRRKYPLQNHNPHKMLSPYHTSYSPPVWMDWSGLVLKFIKFSQF